MNIPDSPRTPKWPFLIGDGILFATACIVGATAPTPISTGALSVVFGCLALGAIIGAAPFVLDFASRQRETERDFQRRLEEQNRQLQLTAEALASTAGQIKSAHEAAGRAVHVAEALPYRLQEKIAEFTNQLQEREDEEKASMAKELELLRDTEGQRLAALVASIQKAIKEFVTIEEKARGAVEAARNLNAEIAPRLTEAASRAELALRQAGGQLQSSIDATDARARDTLAAIEAAAQRLLERTAALRQLEQEFGSGIAAQIDRLQESASAIDSASESASRRCLEAAVLLEQTRPLAPETTTKENPAGPSGMIPLTQLTAFPLRRREGQATRPTEPATPHANASSAPTPPPTAEPATAEPSLKKEPRRKSSSRSLGEAVLPGFAEPEIAYDNEPASHADPARTADGTTRLLVTAFVGIGNKIFVRGEGPGLSWDEGKPLEFLSIGKWSWETADAAEPVKLKLYKNDDLAAQGDVITIPPGHHIEITPVFHENEPF